MRKSLLTVVAILFATSALPQNAPLSSDKDVLETWHCYGIYDNAMKKMLVSLTRFKPDDTTFVHGEVKVAGMTYDAVFEVTGFDRRWSFSSGEVGYAFIIGLDGKGEYYDFSGPRNEYGVESSQSYRCKLV